MTGMVVALMLWGLPWVRPSLPALPSASAVVLTGQDRWLAEDKARHGLASLLLAGALGHVARRQWDVRPPEAKVMGCGVVLGLGVAKELWDRGRPGHQASFKDLAADAAGALLGAWALSW